MLNASEALQMERFTLAERLSQRKQHVSQTLTMFIMQNKRTVGRRQGGDSLQKNLQKEWQQGCDVFRSSQYLTEGAVKRGGTR